MTKSDQIEKQANRIAEAIVKLVECTDGPVTLAQIHREIPGFGTKEPSSWEYVIERHDGKGEVVIWGGMTEAGLAALRKVMSGRRVAVQRLVNPLLYFIEGHCYESENWMPIVLLPARAANLDTRLWRMRGSQAFLDYSIATAAAEGMDDVRLLTPSPVRCTADQFSV
jgi:hypothetical protein